MFPQRRRDSPLHPVASRGRPVPMSIINLIKAAQEKRLDRLQTGDVAPPEHRPEVLFIGCVDARLDPIRDLGIPKGKALIYRNIAALVHGKPDADDLSHMGEEAALEFALNVMRVRDIIVMGHTDCGGVRAALDGMPNHRAIDRYLQSLEAVRVEVLREGGDASAQARAMEEAAVRQSMQNLRSYEVVTDALGEGRLQLHGWLIDTATGIIQEMDHATGAFNEMQKAS